MNMLERISRFCCRYPWLIFVITGIITVLMVQQILLNARFEADLIKFLPTDMPAVKSDDYSRKNFNTQDTLLIGIGKENGTVLEPDVLRSMERIVHGLKNLTATKTFYSKLKGETVTLEQPVGIDSDSVSSIANLEDAILDPETGSVVSGSVVKNLKKKMGIPLKEGQEAALPESDEDLARIIPALKERVLNDRTFRGNILSEDLKAATIRASTIRKQDYKRRYVLLELSTAIDESRLKSRFQGNDTTFPFRIYQSTIDGIKVDDDYIRQHASGIRSETREYLIEILEDVFDDEPKLANLLAQPLTPDSLRQVLQHIERNDFFMNPDVGTWLNFYDGLYDFTLEAIDPFSRENLEFQIHNVKDIVEMTEVYYLSQDLLEANLPKGANGYIAGSPVVIGVFSEMMSGDMQFLVPIAIGVVLLILVLSFRSLRGVLIPLITVVLAVVWTLGLMALVGVPFTIATSGLPIVLLAVGTAYGIHFLNRYYEDTQYTNDRYEIIQRSMRHVGGAIFMAAVTTVAGFSSLATTSLTAIQHFGQFSAVGVILALVLTITLTPAMLVLWRLPKRNPLAQQKSEGELGIVNSFMLRWSQCVNRWTGAVLAVFVLAMVASLYLMRNNYFEGALMSNFREDNILYQSDRFLNKYLTGTTDINLVFSFRDQVNIEKAQTRETFESRIDTFTSSLDQLTDGNPAVSEFSRELTRPLNESLQGLPGTFEQVLDHITLIRNVLNEEYMVFAEESGNMETTDMSTQDFPDGGEPGEMESGDLEALSDEGLESLSDGGLESLADDETEIVSDGGLESLADDSLESLSETGLESLAEGSDDLSGLADTDDLAGLADDAGLSATDPRENAFSSLSDVQIAGLKEIHERLGKPADSWKESARSIIALRKLKTTEGGQQMVHDFNLLSDFLAVDIKQPIVLHKLERLYHYLKALETPKVVIQDKEYKPSGMIVTPVDFVRKFYKVFYHNDDPAYNRLPNVETDGFEDRTLTDRSIIGVVLNQALNASRDDFEAMITPDLKEFQVKIMIRDGSTLTIDSYLDQAMAEINRLFPENDPYIATIRTGGGAFTGTQISKLIGSSQMKSIALSFLLVFIVTFFIFRSVAGGLFSLIPLFFTVILNFGFLAVIGNGEITMSTMLVASVAIGIGIDYTIHFLERLKIQLRQGEPLDQAYSTTVMTTGKAILVNAAAVAAGFLVFLFSRFNTQMMLGILVAATMAFSSLGALTLLPAVILKTKPGFLKKVMANPESEGLPAKN